MYTLDCHKNDYFGLKSVLEDSGVGCVTAQLRLTHTRPRYASISVHLSQWLIVQYWKKKNKNLGE